MFLSTHFSITRLGGAAVLAAVAALALVQAPPQHRKTTDPPQMASGKLGQDLFLALDHRDVESLKAFLAKGANPDSRNPLEFTPLYIAAASHQLDAMQALIDAKASIDAESPYGTPLTFAALGGHAEGAHLLLTKGANPKTARADGTTVLMMAAYSGHPQIIAELIARKAPIDATNGTGATALMYAAKAGNLPAVRILCEAGAKLDLTDVEGSTALMMASKAGKADVVSYLLSRGAKSNLRDESGRSALLLSAAYGDHPDVVRSLKASGCNVGAKDKKGRTSAQLAAQHGYFASAKELGLNRFSSVAPTKRASAALSLKLLERSMTAFNSGATCISCHQEGLGRMATAVAKQHGFSTDAKLNQAQLTRLRGALGAMQPLHERALVDSETMKQVPLIEMNEVTPAYTFILTGMAEQGDSANTGTAAMAMVLARQQAANGSWTFTLPRVPMQSSTIAYTAMAGRDLLVYGPRSQSNEIQERIVKARTWLASAEANSVDDRNYRLLGLKWLGAGASEVRAAAESVRGTQGPDGGWSQLPGMPSDAYATGQSIYALLASGTAVRDDPAVVRGISFLLRTQDDDGSWFVNKRAMPANNYFDASFPHGESQYASFNGTCWATMALIESI